MCAFNADFYVQSAMRRDELFHNWAQYEHDFNVTEKEEYDDHHFDLGEQDVIDVLYDLERVDTVDAFELARNEAFYHARDLLSADSEN